MRKLQIRKYPLLINPPLVPPTFESILGNATYGSNDWVDHNLLAALVTDVVDILVTEDRRLRRKANLLNLLNRVTSIAEALALVKDLFDHVPSPPPAIRAIKAYSLDTTDSLFKSLSIDYPDFDNWIKKCKREHRSTWVVETSGSRLGGVCIVKNEADYPFGLSGKILKLCNFKISQKYNGFRFGELLLKAIFHYAIVNHYTWVYLTIFEKHWQLISLMEDFGFECLEQRTLRGEIVLAKPLFWTEEDLRLDPLSFQIRYGPTAAIVSGAPCYIVPIQPRYHSLLFPEAEETQNLFPGDIPCGNSMRKAYISKARINNIPKGAYLLFYHSQDEQAVTATGVAEDFLISNAANEVARFVGKRTVYSYKNIERLCDTEVKAILFRQSRILNTSITLAELIEYRVVKTAPQSIASVSEEVTHWLQKRVEE